MTTTRAQLATIALTLGAALGGGLISCTSTTTTSPVQAVGVNPAFVTSPAPLSGEILCPITGVVVTTDSPNAWYGVFPVYCASLGDARQFSTLSKAQRARLGAAQVLPQKRIGNQTCPLTGETLTAEAAPVLFDGEIVGFATIADANQFNSLAPAKKVKIVEAWRAAPVPTVQ